MSDVFEEVEESLRTEKAQRTWSRAAPFVYGISALIVLAVGGREYLSYRAQSAIDAAAVSFERGVAAVEAGAFAEAKAAFTETLETDGGFAALSAHYLAQLELAESGDPTSAAAALARGAEGEGPLQDLAALKAAYFSADTVDLETLEAELQPLLDGGGVFKSLARELIAAKAHQSGDLVRARREYSVLTLEFDVPQGVKRRAEIALSAIPLSPETDGDADAGAVEASEDDPS